MATHMAQGLKAVPAARLLHPVEANELFVVVPEEWARTLEAQGFHFYRWQYHVPDNGITIRLVTSFATPKADVDEFLAAAAAITLKG
jgi:threonine aldolase